MTALPASLPADLAMTGIGERPRRRRPSPLWLAAPGIVFLVAFLLLPSLRLLLLGFEEPETGAWSLAAFQRALGVGVYARILSTTFAIAFWTTALSLLLGYPLAYWLVRLPPRFQRLATLLVLLPFWTSALVKNFAWLVLLGRNGIVASGLSALGWQEPELLFGRGTVIFGMTHAMLPLAVVTMMPVMRRIDPRLSLAAGTLGAPGAQSFWRVFFPLSLPGVAAAGLLVFIGSLGFFITPALLGGRQDTMLGQVIILQITQLQNWTFAAALATMLVVSALVTCLLYDALFGLSSLAGGGSGGRRAGRWTRRVGGVLLGCLAAIFSWLSGTFARLLGGPRFSWLLPAFSLLLVAVLVLPILAVVPIGFTSSSFLSFPPPGYSLRWFEEYASSPVWIAATLRSFLVGFVTACLTLAITLPAAFALARTESRLAGAVFLLFLTPMVVPSIVIAVALFYLFAQVSLIATDTGIVIGHTVGSIPIALVILTAILKNHDWQLDRAAATLGAGPWQVLRRITLPAIGGGVFVAFIFAFLHSFEELTIAIFVGGGLKSTLPKQMWDEVTLQVTPTLAAASVVVFAVIFVLFAVAELLGARGAGGRRRASLHGR